MLVFSYWQGDDERVLSGETIQTQLKVSEGNAVDGVGQKKKKGKKKWHLIALHIRRFLIIVQKYRRFAAFFSVIGGGVTGKFIYTGGPIKSEPLPNDQKIVLKPVDEIRFIHQIKVW